MLEFQVRLLSPLPSPSHVFAFSSLTPSPPHLFPHDQRLIKKLWLEANRPLQGPYHADALSDRDLLTEEDDELKAAEESLDGYGFYPIEDDGTTIKRGRKKRVGEFP